MIVPDQGSSCSLSFLIVVRQPTRKSEIQNSNRCVQTTETLVVRSKLVQTGNGYPPSCLLIGSDASLVVFDSCSLNALLILYYGALCVETASNGTTQSPPRDLCG